MFALLNRLMAVLALCGAVEADTGERPELNPLEYVPLEVGNRWTYEHYYLNDFYLNYHYEESGGGAFVIPGYPPGIPPSALRFAEKTVTIEITHTEVIDGVEYFVFSGPDYAWPPLPEFFWGGKKVRLSDEGFLVFRWDGQDISVYDFGVTSSSHGYTHTLPNGAGTAAVLFNRSYGPYRLSSVFFGLSYPRPHPYSSNAEIVFLQGYGIGLTYIYADVDPCEHVVFQNVLAPVSATISGKEIIYEQVRSSYYSFASTGLGQVGQVRMGEGFDFSVGTYSELSNDFELGMYPLSLFDSSGGGGVAGKPACLTLWDTPYPSLATKTGVADLGKIDFGLLIRRLRLSKGVLPDVPLDSIAALVEGHTYAVRSREGGVALLYIFDVEIGDDSYKFIGYSDPRVEGIRFDWVYHPDGLSDKDTAVQSISWGQLKNSLLRMK